MKTKLIHTRNSLPETKRIELSTKHGDATTVDIFTQISRGVDMNLWFIEAHEQAEH